MLDLEIKNSFSHNYTNTVEDYSLIFLKCPRNTRNLSLIEKGREINLSEVKKHHFHIMTI